MKNIIITLIFCCSTLLISAQSEQAEVAESIHHLNVPDGFNYETTEKVSIHLEVYGLEGKRALYRLYGKTPEFGNDLLRQNFVPEDGVLVLQSDIPLHFNQLVMEVSDGSEVRTLEWEKSAMIVDFVEMDLPAHGDSEEQP